MPWPASRKTRILSFEHQLSSPVPFPAAECVQEALSVAQFHGLEKLFGNGARAHNLGDRLARVIFADLSVILDVESGFSFGLGSTISHGPPRDESSTAA